MGIGNASLILLFNNSFADCLAKKAFSESADVSGRLIQCFGQNNQARVSGPNGF